VNELNERLKKLLISKLEIMITNWNLEFLNFDQQREENKVVINNTVHEVRVQNQQISLSPSLESARLYWLNHLQKIVSDICTLPKLKRKNFK